MALVTVVGLLTFPAPTDARAGAQENDTSSIGLASQTPWVGAGGEFTLGLDVKSDRPPGDLEVTVTVFPAVATRSDLGLTFTGRTTGDPVAGPLPYSLAPQPGPAGRLAETGPGGTTVVRLGLQDPAQPRDPNRALLPSRDGVHPVRVELRDRVESAVLDRFVTYLIHLPDAHTAPKLGMALILPVHAPPAIGPDGERREPDARRAAALSAALGALGNSPISLAPTPETVDAHAAASDERNAGALDALRRAATQYPFLSSSYVPANLAALLDAGLDAEAGAQVERGAAALEQSLRVRPDTRTWAATEPLDERTVEVLRSRGVQRVVAVEPILEPVTDQKVTLTRPFLLEAEGDPLPAAVADAGLALHFDNEDNQVLLANRLLADLAVLYLDLPGREPRGVVAMAPRAWTPDRVFLSTVLTGLTQSPIAEAISLEQLFTSVPLARAGSRPLVRHTSSGATDGFQGLATAIRSARERIESFRALLGPDSSAPLAMEQRLLTAQSADLRTTRARSAYLSGVERGIADHLGSIRMPEGRSITLTSRRGEIPVTFQNRTGSAVRVVVKVQSDKLEFPGGTERTVDLVRRNTTERFTVVARTSGAFPLRITLESPDGGLVVGRARLTVRSTATTGISVAVSLGAAGFLAVWWARHIVRGRRARRLVPA